MNKYTKPGKGRNPSTAKPVKTSDVTKRLFSKITVPVPEYVQLTIDNGEVISQKAITDDKPYAEIIAGHIRARAAITLGLNPETVAIMREGVHGDNVLYMMPRLPGRKTMEGLAMIDFEAWFNPPRNQTPKGRMSASPTGRIPKPDPFPFKTRADRVNEPKLDAIHDAAAHVSIALEMDFADIERRLLSMLVTDRDWLLNFVATTDMDRDSLKKLRFAIQYDAGPVTLVRILQEAKRSK